VEGRDESSGGNLGEGSGVLLSLGRGSLEVEELGLEVELSGGVGA